MSLADAKLGPLNEAMEVLRLGDAKQRGRAAGKIADAVVGMADKSLVTALTTSLVTAALLKEEDSQADCILALLQLQTCQKFSKQTFFDAGGTDALKAALEVGNGAAKEHAAKVVWELARNDLLVQDAFAGNGLIAMLVNTLTKNYQQGVTAKVQQWLLNALRCGTSLSAAACVAAREAGATKLLSDLAKQSPTMEMRENAAQALINFRVVAESGNERPPIKAEYMYSPAGTGTSQDMNTTGWYTLYPQWDRANQATNGIGGHPDNQWSVKDHMGRLLQG